MSDQVAVCKVCSSKSNFIFRNLVRQKYNVNFYQCSHCGFVQPDEPYWLEEAYSLSMNLGDTGQVVRNLSAKRVLVALATLWFDRFGKYLDFASGYGFFVRIMRDVGLDCYWADKYTDNLLARGFEADLSGEKYELVSVFECFEHWPNPDDEITSLLTYSSSILFTTNLVSNPAPSPNEWWYYGFDHGQHVSFFTAQSLKILASKHKLNFYSKRGFHLLTRKKINPWLFKLVVRLALSGYLNFLDRFFKSRTQSDFRYLVTKTVS